MDGQRSEDVDAVVGTDAALTIVPASVLQEIGVEPIGQRRFLLTDGRRVFMDYCEAKASVSGESVM